MGTLDPMAEGVLPVGLGKASRLFQYLLDKEKTYVARFLFGVSTDTLDVTGETIKTTNAIPSLKEIESVLPSFIGEIDQIPPKYSAKCVAGKRSYELARKGVEFELPPKKVTVLDMKCLGQTGENEFEFKIDCKGGTYIRSLARDVASACNSLGVMSKLTRTKCGIFTIENGVTVDELKQTEDASRFIIPADEAVSFPKIVLSNERATRILNGLFDKYPASDGVYRVYNEQAFWGVGTIEDGILKITSYVR